MSEAKSGSRWLPACSRLSEANDLAWSGAEEEQSIIQQRISLQRKMLEEYERRELRRKVLELQDICQGLSDQEAEMALKLTNGRCVRPELLANRPGVPTIRIGCTRAGRTRRPSS